MIDDFDSCSTKTGYFTDIDTGIVYCCQDRCGSMPRDIVEESQGYTVRSALYPEIIPAVRGLLDELAKDRAILREIVVDQDRREHKHKTLIEELGRLWRDVERLEQAVRFDLEVMRVGMERREEAIARMLNTLWLGR